MQSIYKKLFLLFLLFSYANATTYSLYIASTKYTKTAKNYIEEVNDILKIDNLLVRTHEKKNYSLIVNQIKDINYARKLQDKLNKLSSYKDSYIKKDVNSLNYGIVFYTKTINKKVVIKEMKEADKDFILEVESSNEYITASTMYNIGNYKRSYELFKKLFYKYNYNVNVNYFLAQSAIKIKMYDEASIALERVLIENPKFNKARYDYAKLLTNLNLKKEAIEEFNILLKENITDKTRTDVKKYLNFLNKKKTYTSNSANLILGVGHNTNINNGLLTRDYRLPGIGNILVSGEEPIKDNFHNEILSIDLKKVLKSNPKIRIKNSFLAYNKSYFNEKNENISVLSYRPNISYLDTQNMYGLDLNATRVIKKDNNDINVFSLSPSLANKHIRTSFNYQKLLYTHKENKDKNFEMYELEFTYNILNNIKMYTNISRTKRIKKERIDIDKTLKTIGIKYNYKFNNKNMVYLAYKIEKNNFRYINPFFNTKRKDIRHNLILNYLYSINNQSKVNLLTSFSKNNSNQDAYLYEEFEITLNLIKRFDWK
jgi:hypothetical protein